MICPPMHPCKSAQLICATDHRTASVCNAWSSCANNSIKGRLEGNWNFSFLRLMERSRYADITTKDTFIVNFFFRNKCIRDKQLMQADRQYPRRPMLRSLRDHIQIDILSNSRKHLHRPLAVPWQYRPVSE